MKAPAFQFYPKQWLGDDKVMAMDWDARAMHMHLICIAWQQEPPCTLPDDDDMIRRWLGNPRKWEMLKSQIFTAWKRENGRWIQPGLVAQFVRQSTFSKTRRDAANTRWEKEKAYAYALHVQCENDALQSSSTSSSSLTSENQEDSSESLPEKPVDACMFASAVLLECRIGGRDLRMVLEEIGRAEAAHGEDLEALAEQASRAWVEYCAAKPMLEYAWGASKFFGEGYWKTPEIWPRIGAKPTAKEIAWKKFEERTRDADEAE